MRKIFILFVFIISGCVLKKKEFDPLLPPLTIYGNVQFMEDFKPAGKKSIKLVDANSGELIDSVINLQSSGRVLIGDTLYSNYRIFEVPFIFQYQNTRKCKLVITTGINKFKREILLNPTKKGDNYYDISIHSPPQFYVSSATFTTSSYWISASTVKFSYSKSYSSPFVIFTSKEPTVSPTRFNKAFIRTTGLSASINIDHLLAGGTFKKGDKVYIKVFAANKRIFGSEWANVIELKDDFYYTNNNLYFDAYHSDINGVYYQASLIKYSERVAYDYINDVLLPSCSLTGSPLYSIVLPQ